MKIEATLESAEGLARTAALRLQDHRLRLAVGIAPSNARMGRLAANPTTYAGNESAPCEKCGRATFFNVIVIGRVAAWCGCE